MGSTPTCNSLINRLKPDPVKFTYADSNLIDIFMTITRSKLTRIKQIMGSNLTRNSMINRLKPDPSKFITEDSNLTRNIFMRITR